MSRMPSLVVVMNEPCLPAINGGRIDMWTRHKALKDCGCRLMLVTWLPVNRVDGPPMAELREVFDEIHIYPITQSARALAYRLLALPMYSPHVSTRILGKQTLRELVRASTQFRADAVWLDGLYGGHTAVKLAKTLSKPLYYRAHNVEYSYMRSQAAAAYRPRDKFAWNLAALGLRRFEEEIQRSSSHVFNISRDDIEFWKKRGLQNAIWLPTTLQMDAQETHSRDYFDRSWDLVYVGNLRSPNNFVGLDWFVRKVLPIVRLDRPNIRVCIAGSNPTEEIRALLSQATGIDLMENPENAFSLWREGRVLINPILTGSGINVKSVEMLFFDAHLITTNVGARGLPPHVRDEFLIADTPELFAQEIITKLSTPFVAESLRPVARQEFGNTRIRALIESISEDCFER
jgi:hypothetical protein